jgi:hypothetical protein
LESVAVHAVRIPMNLLRRRTQRDQPRLHVTGYDHDSCGISKQRAIVKSVRFEKVAAARVVALNMHDERKLQPPTASRT